jgi:hypothetical protein
MRQFLALLFLRCSDALDKTRLKGLAVLHTRVANFESISEHFRKVRDLEIARSSRLQKQYTELLEQNFKAQMEAPKFVVAPSWGDDDVIAFGKFLATNSGQALKARLQAMVSTVCIAGCGSEINTTHAAGVGAGWEECVRKLLEHAKISRVAGVQATNNEHPPGEEDLLEQFSP